MKGKVKRTVGITIRLDATKRDAFNEYAKNTGVSPGNLIRQFIYQTVASEK